jgi:uncharacterized membrane protein (DUF4010 family)
MATSEPSSQHSGLRLTKFAAVIACLFVLPSAAFSPGPGSSLGMPWSAFFCTWGVTLVSALISFVGYVVCRTRGKRISVFYAICPALLFVVFLVFLNLRDIVRAFAS